MKVKGINPIEQHVEKIVLGLVALVLLGVLAMQFLTQPNVVDVGGRDVPPQNVFVELQRQAETLDSQLKDAAPALPQVQQTDLVDRYDRAFSNASDAPTRLATALGQPVSVAAAAGAQIAAGAQSSDQIAPLTVPVPAAPIAASQWGTLDPYAVQTVPEYAAFVPAEQPYDLPTVTVEAAFSGTALRDALNPAEGPGVPRRFWQATGMAIMGLEVERQRLNDDGSWSDPEPIVTPPGTPRPTGAILPDAGLPQLTELVSRANTAAPDVQRPFPPPMIAGPEWTPPSERVQTDEASLSEADRVRRSLERAVAELDRLRNAPQQTTTPPRSPRTPATTGPGSSRPGGAAQPNQRRIEQLERQIEQHRARLAELGEADPTAAAPGRPARAGARTEVPQLLEQQSVQLWAHDMGVEPGATYRYRVKVVVNNPLFRKGPSLDPDDESLQTAAADPFARSDWTEWSAPVVVGAREYFFVSSADAEGTMSEGRASASIEVFRMFYGFYRKSTLTLTPGDPVETSIRIPDGLYTFNTGVLDAQAAAQALQAEPGAALPPGLSPISGRLSISPGALVLDVATRPVQVQDDLGRSLTVSEVLLRSADGRVLVRTGREDTAREAYRQANASSAAASRATLGAPGQPALSPSAELFLPPEPQP